MIATPNTVMHELVFTLAEVRAMENMLQADMQRISQIKRWLPGSRIDRVAPQSGKSG